MQTFLPYECIAASAACLDRQRLGKQRVETKQLLQALGVAVGGPLPDRPSSWRNHPAAKMWAGFEHALAYYGHTVCVAWRMRGYQDSLMPQFEGVLWTFQRNGVSLEMPPWLGDENFHAAHRSNLLRKDANWYGQFGWREPDNLPYVWPEPAGAVI